jgi:hypothetical protein
MNLTYQLELQDLVKLIFYKNDPNKQFEYLFKELKEWVNYTDKSKRNPIILTKHFSFWIRKPFCFSFKLKEHPKRNQQVIMIQLGYFAFLVIFNKRGI